MKKKRETSMPGKELTKRIERHFFSPQMTVTTEGKGVKIERNREEVDGGEDEDVNELTIIPSSFSVLKCIRLLLFLLRDWIKRMKDWGRIKRREDDEQGKWSWEERDERDTEIPLTKEGKVDEDWKYGDKKVNEIDLCPHLCSRGRALLQEKCN